MIQENGALVEFYRDAVQNNFKSAEAGRPIFDEKDFVRIQTPGDTRTVIARVASDQDKQRFPRAWDAFSRGLEIAEQGTPLEEWPQVTRSQVKELKHVNITTVESLASVSDGNIQRLGPGYHQLRERAKQFLESADADAAATEWAREREAMQERIRLLEEANEALKAENAGKHAASSADAPANDPDGNPPSPINPEPNEKPKRGPGRPARTAE